MARPMQSTFLVMAGGAIGAAARYHSAIGVARLAGDRWPFATLSVNLVGALVMGVLAGWALSRGLSENLRLFFAVGMLGGFTTFSAFSMESWQLFEAGRAAAAFGYVAASVVGTIVMVGLGISLVRAVSA